jgi:D-methionine transport system substrate-binding protein
MKFRIGTFISAVWLFAAPLASAETVKVGVLPNVYAQSLEALIPEARAGYPDR